MRAMDCADYIVDMAIENDLDITNLQLQKALYVFAAEYRRLYSGEYPYDTDRIMAWNYGPVIPNVYREYKSYESCPITEVSKHEEFDINTCEFIEHRYDSVENIDDVICPNYRQIVEDNLANFLNLNIFKVVDFTHRQNFWSDHHREIYVYDNVEYPIEEITLDNMDLVQFIRSME